MKEPIFDPKFWKDRLEKAPDLHQSVYECGKVLFDSIEAKHRENLYKFIRDEDSIIDCGCGYGRILDLLPDDWIGPYLGVDISPDLIYKAETTYYKHPGTFQVVDLRELSKKVYAYGRINPNKFDWALLIAMRSMIIRNVSEDVWEHILSEVRLVATNVLLLEFNATHEGEII